MNVVFISVLFTNTVLSLSFLIMCLQRRSGDKLEKILAFVTASSLFWSWGAGLLVAQKDDFWAQISRCVDLFGTVSFMISIIMLLNCIAEYEGRLYKYFHAFSLLGYVLLIFSFFPGIYTFTRSDWGMSFQFKNQLYGYIYVAFFTLCVCVMIFYLTIMLKSKKKSITFFGKALLIIMIIIILGTGSDMFLPFLGSPSAPGSSIAQFWALIIVWYAVDNISHSRLTVKNMSHKVYYDLTTPVIMADIQGRVLVCNDAARDFFGFTKKEGDVLANMYDLFTLPSVEDIPELLPTLSFDSFCNINHIYCNIVSNTIFDRFNEPIGYISVITDLSKQLEAVEKIEEARKDAIEANEAKSIFLANMSHEIRTPVNAIVGFSDVALAENPPERIKDYLIDIKNASGTLLSSINDILNISKIESGKMELVDEEYSFRRLLKNVSKIISVQAAAKNLKFDVELSGLVPYKLYGDDVRIQEVLINLCNNAVKYTTEGYVKLKVKGTKQEDGRLLVEFNVVDTGMGIKEEDLANLFAAYERVNMEKNHRTEGTGLGLAIVKGYVDLMGGTVNVESEYLKGSTFTVTLTQKIIDETPVSLEEIMKNEETVSKMGGFAIKNMKFLVVDDNRVNLKVISRIFEKYGVTPDLAQSGAESISMCQNTQYPVIFMDQMMPEMDGLEAMLTLRKMDEYYKNESKIIVFSANATDGVKEELIAAGFDDYLSKPVNYLQFEQIIKKHVPTENIEERDDD